MKYHTHVSRFFLIIIMTTLTQPSKGMKQSPSSPQVPSSPKTLFVYDLLKNNDFLFKLLKETPNIIEQCIDATIRTSDIAGWLAPRVYETWEPVTTPCSPATVQGCYMEFCDSIPVALITPWGRQPFFKNFESETYRSIIKKMIPFLLEKITIASQPTAMGYWKTNDATHQTTFFEVVTINNVLLEKPQLSNYVLFKLLKETPDIIKQCITTTKKESDLKDWHEPESSWYIPQVCQTLSPKKIPWSPTTVQGCYMEFCDDIPRALITPWGRQPFFTGKTYHSFLKKMIPFLLEKITIASKPHPTAMGYWKTKYETYTTTFFEVIAINDVLLEQPALSDTLNPSTDESILIDWNRAVKCYEKEQRKALLKKIKHIPQILKEITQGKIRAQEEKDLHARNEIAAILSVHNSCVKPFEPIERK